MAGTFTNLNYHLVFSTKKRVESIGPDLKPRLYEYIGGIIRGEGRVLSEIGGTSDHVHLLVRWHPKTSVSELLQVIKSHSSGWVHKDFSDRFFGWQDGYGAFTVSESQCKHVQRYIQGQETHHAKQGFKEEFLAILKKYDISYDERYIWE